MLNFFGHVLLLSVSVLSLFNAITLFFLDLDDQIDMDKAYHINKQEKKNEK